MTSKIAIVGSGFLGLTLALRLAQQGNAVTIFESAEEIGGLASAWQIGDTTWDKHYHVTLLSDSYTRKIVGELGLEDEFEWVETRTGFYTDGKLVSMSNTMEFLKFPPLGLLSKLRLGGTIFFASRVKNWKKLEKISVEDWLTRLSGKRTFEKMWKPLLKAKLGEAYKETSAAFIWATIQRMYAARNSGLKKEMFGYVRGGYATVLKRFAVVLESNGVVVKLNSPVLAVERPMNKEELSVTFSKRGDVKETKIEIFDKVIITTPSNIAESICPQLTESEKQKLNKIKYQGIVCASLLTKHSLSPYYVTNITDKTPFTGIIEMSALVDKNEFGENALIYLPKYITPNDDLFEKSEAEIKEIFLSALEGMYTHFSRDDVKDFKVSRVRQVFPLPTLNYSEAVPSVETSIPNMFILNSAQITNGTLNVNETIRCAEEFIKEWF
ncbi:MAG: NAD(P)/FAD-dependent oxidoreductase [Pyrinomonadaceae bacterium]